jgi:UDP-MurNAc hydroxylase
MQVQTAPYERDDGYPEKMRITYLGHAGFCVETPRVVLIMDPWLSADGAFDSAWFQFPRNHHLAAFVRDKLSDSRKERFLYISHEHKDHFDRAFLNSLQDRDFTLIVPHFQRPAIRAALSDYRSKALISFTDGQEVTIPDGHLKLYLDDSGLNRDSAILLRAGGQSFLDLNDCKVFDRLSSIAQEQGPINAFACQFSGATWHPTCYDYSPEVYQQISKHKYLSKFETVARAIETIRPRIFLPSAGPACFLDPMLLHLNFECVNIFPHAPKLLRYLGQRLDNSATHCMDIMPGDVLDVESGQYVKRVSERVSEDNFEVYVRSYAALYEGFFAEQQAQYSEGEINTIMERLRVELGRKLSALTLRKRVRTPLYFALTDCVRQMVRVDFVNGTVELASQILDADYYSIRAPSWCVVRVLDGKLTWEDFALTFRMRLDREPDVYQTLMQGFLLMEPEDMNWFCAKLLNIEETQKRVVVEAGGTRYSIDRYCPHQGGDLSLGWPEQGRLWTCPRHRWQFDLEKEGRCTTSETSIRAICLEPD